MFGIFFVVFKNTFFFFNFKKLFFESFSTLLISLIIDINDAMTYTFFMEVLRFQYEKKTGQSNELKNFSI